MKKENSPLGTAANLISGVAGRVIIGALLVLLVFEGVRLSFDFGHAIFYQEPVEAAPGTDHKVELPQDTSISDAGALLKEAGLIRNELAFDIQGRLYQTKLYPGEYTLNTSMTTKEILEKLNTEGETYEEAAGKAPAETESGGVIGGGDEADGETDSAASGAADAEENASGAGAAADGTASDEPAADEAGAAETAGAAADGGANG